MRALGGDRELADRGRTLGRAVVELVKDLEALALDPGSGLVEVLDLEDHGENVLAGVAEELAHHVLPALGVDELCGPKYFSAEAHSAMAGLDIFPVGRPDVQAVLGVGLSCQLSLIGQGQ